MAENQRQVAGTQSDPGLPPCGSPAPRAHIWFQTATPGPSLSLSRIESPGDPPMTSHGTRGRSPMLL